jgi:hypothetical protein
MSSLRRDARARPGLAVDGAAEAWSGTTSKQDVQDRIGQRQAARAAHAFGTGRPGEPAGPKLPGFACGIGAGRPRHPARRTRPPDACGGAALPQRLSSRVPSTGFRRRCRPAPGDQNSGRTRCGERWNWRMSLEGCGGAGGRQSAEARQAPLAADACGLSSVAPPVETTTPSWCASVSSHLRTIWIRGYPPHPNPLASGRGTSEYGSQPPEAGWRFDMKASRSKRCTSCSFFRSAP